MIALLRQIEAVARKEIGAHFGSPTALIFVGVFLLVTLLSFFWVETFYARNIADVRPLFEWMPVLMMFLAGVLTMRQWSEEQRGGTMEVLLTLPVERPLLVAGKFVGVMTLIIAALTVTLVLPITVSQLGDLDWGPVVGGYIAALLMSSSYVAIGLFVSSRTDNQIVSFILAVLICSVLYVVGTSGVTGIVGDTGTQVLRSIGLGSRFESIERGVIDLRDLTYYFSLTAFFLLLNVVSLDIKRWSWSQRTATYRRNTFLGVVLLALNLVALNTWLFPLSGLRLDLTAQQKYSLSEVTVDLVGDLPEPLLLRGYFSERTHPALTPLLPAIRDLMREYEVVSGGVIRVEILDPRKDEEVEAEANQAYGIRPTPFRITERYEASVVNSYFDVLVRYGDQFVTLGLNDLIEVSPAGGDDVDVKVGNLEYVLTRSIKKAVFGFQSLDSALQQIENPINLTLLATTAALPETLQEVPGRIENVARKIEQESRGKLVFNIVDPDTEGSLIDRGELLRSYGLRPIASLLNPHTYYLHLLIESGHDSRALYPNGELSEDELRSEIEAALKRSVPGFLKTVGLWYPPETASGSIRGPISSFQILRQHLAQTYDVKGVDLSMGRVPGEVDVLVIVSPRQFTDRDRFAVDQFLMQGGSVVVASGNYVLSPLQFGGAPVVEPVLDGLRTMLASYGVLVRDGIIMDLQNTTLPTQVQRNVGGFNVVEIEEINYPPFVDVRRNGMAQESSIVSSVPSLTLYWVSPLEIDPGKNRRRDVVMLLQSSEDAWLRTSTDLEPNLETYPDVGFPIEGQQKAWDLGVSIRGSFESFFKDRTSPFENGTQLEKEQIPQDVPVSGKIVVSPKNSRLVVIGSSEFLNDAMLSLSRSQSADRYLLNLQLVQNSIDWAVEDEDLLSIRSQGDYARLLRPMDEGAQRFWEAVNYAVAIVVIMVIGLLWHLLKRREAPMELVGDE